MGAIVNGLALSGFRAYGAGFLIFSDYMKGSIRLAAIMRIPSTFVFTHDSIGVGEDGPTHQPIEQLVTLRATPNLDVVRPAGLQRDRARVAPCPAPDRPADRARASAARGCRCGTRPRSPTTRSSAAPTCCATAPAATRRSILMATGSEVHIANDAAKLLEAEGIAGTARVDALPRPLRRAGPGLPRQRAAAGRPRAGVGRGGEPDRLAPLGRRPRRRRGDGGLRRLRAREGPLRALRLHRRGGRRARTGGARRSRGA